MNLPLFLPSPVHGTVVVFQTALFLELHFPPPSLPHPLLLAAAFSPQRNSIAHCRHSEMQLNGHHSNAMTLAAMERKILMVRGEQKVPIAHTN